MPADAVRARLLVDRGQARPPGEAARTAASWPYARSFGSAVVLQVFKISALPAGCVVVLTWAPRTTLVRTVPWMTSKALTLSATASWLTPQPWPSCAWTPFAERDARRLTRHLRGLAR